MKATLVKDDNFKTIGFEVEANGRRVFGWGISPKSPLYWIKEINAKAWSDEIFTLIELQARISEQRDFRHDFFEVARTSDAIKEVLADTGVHMTAHEEKCKRTEERMLSIIYSIS